MGTILAGYEGPKHRVMARNAASRRFVGRAEVIGKPLLELLPEFEEQHILAMASPWPTACTRWASQRSGASGGSAQPALASPVQRRSGHLVGVRASAAGPGRLRG